MLLKKFFTDSPVATTTSHKEANKWLLEGKEVFAFLTDSFGCTVRTDALVSITDSSVTDKCNTSYAYTNQNGATKVCVIAFFNTTINEKTCSATVVQNWLNKSHSVFAFFLRNDQINWSDLHTAWRDIDNAPIFHSSQIVEIEASTGTFQTESGSLYDFS